MATITNTANNTAVNFTADHAASIANIHSGSVNFGPLTVSWNLDLSIPRIVADATIHGISVGHAVIDTDHPTAALGGSLGIAKAEIILNADFAKKQLEYDVDVELFGHKIVDKAGILFTW